MDNITLYPELIDYMYQYCEEFKTSDEILAGRTILYHEKNIMDKAREVIISKGWYSDAAYIKAMIAEGYEPFKRKVVERIFLKQSDELKLNFARNVLSSPVHHWQKKCRFCFHDWNLKK